jgi:hypothetical protein
MPQARIYFSLAMMWSKSLKILQWCGNDGNESRLAIGAFWGFRPVLHWRKAYSLDQEISHLSNVL